MDTNSKRLFCGCPHSALYTNQETYSSISNSETDSSPVQLFCRLKPLRDANDLCCITALTPEQLCLNTPLEDMPFQRSTIYSFKNIFNARSSQKEIFQQVAYPLLQGLMEGENGLLLFYGISDSGKNYVFNGNVNDPGILPRCIDTLFNTINHTQMKKYVIKPDQMKGFVLQTDRAAAEDRDLEHKTNVQLAKSGKIFNGSGKSLRVLDGVSVDGINDANLYSAFVSYVEVCDNFIYDLLDESDGKTLPSKTAAEDGLGTMFVSDVVEIEVKSSGEAYHLFSLGQKRKRAYHAMVNDKSSNGHLIFNIRLVQISKKWLNFEEISVAENYLKVGQLTLVDLAKAEVNNTAESSEAHLNEVNNLDPSLQHLLECLKMLKDDNSSIDDLILHKNNELTLLFKSYFEGDGDISMILCLNPAMQYYKENVSALKFAEINKFIKIDTKETITVEKETKTDTPNIPKPTSTTSNEETKLPIVKANFENVEASDATITRLLKALTTAGNNTLNCDAELIACRKRFRERLIDMKRKNVSNRFEHRMLREGQKVLANKDSPTETIKTDLTVQTDENQDSVVRLRISVDLDDVKGNQEEIERERSRTAMRKQLKLHQELKECIKLQRKIFENHMDPDELKLQSIQHMLNEESIQTVKHKIEKKLHALSKQKLLSGEHSKFIVEINTNDPAASNGASAHQSKFTEDIEGFQVEFRSTFGCRCTEGNCSEDDKVGSTERPCHQTKSAKKVGTEDGQRGSVGTPIQAGLDEGNSRSN